MTEADAPAPQPRNRSKLAETLARRERFRDDYRNDRDPFADERLLWPPQTTTTASHLALTVMRRTGSMFEVTLPAPAGRRLDLLFSWIGRIGSTSVTRELIH